MTDKYLGRLGALICLSFLKIISSNKGRLHTVDVCSSCAVHWETTVTSFQILRSCRVKLEISSAVTEKNLCSICSLLCYVNSYQRPSSALPSALSSPVGGSLAHYVSRPSLAPAPLFLSGNPWHPPQLVFSHTCHIGWHLGGDVRREQR